MQWLLRKIVSHKSWQLGAELFDTHLIRLYLPWTLLVLTYLIADKVLASWPFSSCLLSLVFHSPLILWWLVMKASILSAKSSAAMIESGGEKRHLFLLWLLMEVNANITSRYPPGYLSALQDKCGIKEIEWISIWDFIRTGSHLISTYSGGSTSRGRQFKWLID